MPDQRGGPGIGDKQFFPSDYHRKAYTALVVATTKLATYAEYLALESGSEVKHEFIDGVIVAMSGGTVAHGRLIARATRLLNDGIKERPCVVMPSDMRLRIRAANRTTYPDLYVVCGGFENADDDPHALVNPTVIVEVLSGSTEDSDRSDKFAAYRRLPSLREYVLISQQERRVEVFRRDGRAWRLDEFRAGDTLALVSLDIELAVTDIYIDAIGPIIA